MLNYKKNIKLPKIQWEINKNYYKNGILFIHIKTNKIISKYKIKSFFFDFYGKEIKTISSFVKKKKQKIKKEFLIQLI